MPVAYVILQHVAGDTRKRGDRNVIGANGQEDHRRVARELDAAGAEDNRHVVDLSETLLLGLVAGDAQSTGVLAEERPILVDRDQRIRGSQGCRAEASDGGSGEPKLTDVRSPASSLIQSRQPAADLSA